MTKPGLLFCVGAFALVATDAFAQRTTRSDTFEVRQQCITEAQSRFPGGGGDNASRGREMAYRNCMSKHGLRP
jgi:hypothetical protein